MSKFKVGDRVRRTRPAPDLTIGGVYVVGETDHESSSVGLI